MYKILPALPAIILFTFSVGVGAEGLRLEKKSRAHISLGSEAQEERLLPFVPLIFEKSNKPKECGIRFYGHARHLGTSVKYNERNWGWARECYPDRYGHGLYYHAGHLLNSYGCMTGVAGVGYKQSLLTLAYMHLGIGLEADYLKYCIPAYINSKGVYVPGKLLEGGPLIFPLGYVEYRYGWLHAHLNLHYLGRNVWLWSLSVRY